MISKGVDITNFNRFFERLNVLLSNGSIRSDRNQSVANFTTLTDSWMKNLTFLLRGTYGEPAISARRRWARRDEHEKWAREMAARGMISERTIKHRKVKHVDQSARIQILINRYIGESWARLNWGEKLNTDLFLTTKYCNPLNWFELEHRDEDSLIDSIKVFRDDRWLSSLVVHQHRSSEHTNEYYFPHWWASRERPKELDEYIQRGTRVDDGPRKIWSNATKFLRLLFDPKCNRLLYSQDVICSLSYRRVW